MGRWIASAALDAPPFFSTIADALNTGNYPAKPVPDANIIAEFTVDSDMAALQLGISLKYPGGPDGGAPNVAGIVHDEYPWTLEVEYRVDMAYPPVAGEDLFWFNVAYGSNTPADQRSTGGSWSSAFYNYGGGRTLVSQGTVRGNWEAGTNLQGMHVRVWAVCYSWANGWELGAGYTSTAVYYQPWDQATVPRVSVNAIAESIGAVGPTLSGVLASGHISSPGGLGTTDPFEFEPSYYESFHYQITSYAGGDWDYSVTWTYNPTTGRYDRSGGFIGGWFVEQWQRPDGWPSDPPDDVNLAYSNPNGPTMYDGTYSIAFDSNDIPNGEQIVELKHDMSWYLGQPILGEAKTRRLIYYSPGPFEMDWFFVGQPDGRYYGGPLT